MKKHKKLIIILIIIFLIGLGLFVLFHKNGITLPLYEYKCGKDPCYMTEYNADYEDLGIKLSTVVNCKYDVCRWYESEKPKDDYCYFSEKDNSYLVLYDNNANNDGGYYLYDSNVRKAKYGAYKKIDFDINTHYIKNDNAKSYSCYKTVYGVVTTDKKNQQGYFLLENYYAYNDYNRFTISPDKYKINTYGAKIISVMKDKDSKLAFFSVSGKQLTDYVYDDVTLDINYPLDIFVTEKNGKYNAFSFVSDNSDQYVLFDDDYDYIKFIYFDYESEYMYYFYAKDGKLYLTRNSIKDIDISCKLNFEKMICKFNENSNYNILVESNFDKNNLVSVEKYNEQDNTIVIIAKSHYYTINLFTHDVAKELLNN